jgi:signal peptidase II
VRVLFLTLAIVIADQVTKLLVHGIQIPSLGIAWDGMPYGMSRPLIGDFMRLTYIENPGMAFGFGTGGTPYFAIFSLIASIALIAYLYHMRTGPFGFRLALAAVLGGAVGNLIDRVFYGVVFGYAPLFRGRVVDFLDMDFVDFTMFGYHMSRFAIFNIADSSVTVGIILLLYMQYAESRAAAPPPPPAPPAEPS